MSNYEVGDYIEVVDNGLRDKVTEEVDPSIKLFNIESYAGGEYRLITAGKFNNIDGQKLYVNFSINNTGASTILVDDLVTPIAIVKELPNISVLPNELSGIILLIYFSSDNVFLALPLSTIDQINNAYTHPATHPVSMITDAMSTTEVNTAITDAITNLIDSSPANLDTLSELAAALNNDDDFSTTINNLISSRAQFKEIISVFPNGQTVFTVNDSFIQELNCRIDIVVDGDADGLWSATYVNGSATITSDTVESSDVNFKVHIFK